MERKPLCRSNCVQAYRHFGIYRSLPVEFKVYDVIHYRTKKYLNNNDIIITIIEPIICICDRTQARRSRMCAMVFGLDNNVLPLTYNYRY